MSVDIKILSIRKEINIQFKFKNVVGYSITHTAILFMILVWN